MAYQTHSYGSSFQNRMVCEVEVVLEDDEEDPEANSDHFGKRDDSGFIDTLLPWSIQACNSGMNQVLTYCNNGVNIEEQPKAENSEADRVPGPRRRRPRTQFGLSAWQKEQLESVFQTTPYPDVIVMYVACFRPLLLSVVHGVF